EAFEYITSKGIEVLFQLLPDDDSKSWETMKKKYDSLG
ncbi:PTS mannose/fructose/sorbose transporter subunit IIB, partial [Listeria monocytogenes]|nr:PTS mannose/fructose/sorbose transporter subunit IIB [Listeria monocytogenes]